jgi:transcriptional regulator with XRE-family HTH domain
MLSPLGKELRKLRIDRDLRLFDMARKIDVTTGFLSAVENGKKAVPAGFVQRVVQAFDLSAQDATRLQQAADASRTSIKLELAGKGIASRELATAFARTFENADEAKAKELLARLLMQ